MMKALPDGAIQAVEAEIDRQHIMRSLVRVAVNNTKDDDDYDCMSTKASWEYGKLAVEHGLVYRVLWTVIGCLVLSINGWYEYFRDWNRSR